MLHVHSTSPLCNGLRLWAAATLWNSLTSPLAGLKWLSGTFPVKDLCQEYGNDLGKCHTVVRTCPGVVQYSVCCSPVFSWRDHLCLLCLCTAAGLMCWGWIPCMGCLVCADEASANGYGGSHGRACEHTYLHALRHTCTNTHTSICARTCTHTSVKDL